MRILFVTCSPEEASDLVRQLVEERYIAGCNILSGVRSIYRWKGEICEEPECVLLMETSEDRLPAAMQRIRELHSYEVPKILAFPPDASLPEYLSWVREMTRPE